MKQAAAFSFRKLIKKKHEVNHYLDFAPSSLQAYLTILSPVWISGKHMSLS